MNDANNPLDLFGVLVVGALLVVWLLFFVIVLLIFPAWLRSFLGGAPVMALQLIAMRLRGVPPRLIVDSLVTLVQRGHPHDPSRVRLAESIYLAQRGLIYSSAQLADEVEKQLKA